MSIVETASETPGLPARRLATGVIERVLRGRRPLEDALAAANLDALEDARDRALVRRIAGTVLRRLGTLRTLLGAAMERGLPAQAPRLEPILLTGAAQILFLDVPDRAAVDLAVRLAQEDRMAARYVPLVNAVLRRLSRDRKRQLAALDPFEHDTPDWLRARWTANYGADKTRLIATAHAVEPALDLTVRDDPAGWAERLGGIVLPTGTVRLTESGAIPALPGFADGGWWVQDAAAALPARLLGNVRGKSVADICAAPGGKTAQLAAAGANVTAIDRSEQRLERLKSNLERLRLSADIVTADATTYSGGPFDAILLDAPCSATGTIRRHPDVAWLKTARDLDSLTALQTRLLDHVPTLLKPGGVLVYCTCSLEPEEGEHAIAALLDRNPNLRGIPIRPDEIGGLDAITPAGELRTLPGVGPIAMDGFFAARLQRVA